MKRKIYDSLLAWKADSDRKPLILEGARQVGKTYILMEFGKCEYDNLIYINCQNNSFMQNLFTMDFDMERILRDISAYAGQGIVPGKTLIFFDEAQDAPRCVEALKYFCENAPEYAIVAAGSLLGVALHEGTSFPVGKVDFLNLYPLNFQEFLLAMGEDGLAELLNGGDYDMISAFSEKYKDLLRKYYYVGGMPEVVRTYIETDDLEEVRALQKQLLVYYANDFSKHAPKETVPRIQMIWNSIPMQLAKENRKFVYGIVREGARAKDFEMAIQWLADCGLIHKSYRVTKPGMPLISYLEMNSFKIYLLDVGLLAAQENLCHRRKGRVYRRSESGRRIYQREGALRTLEGYGCHAGGGSGTEFYDFVFANVEYYPEAAGEL